MANWDVFKNDQLQVLRSLTTEQVHALLARGEIQVDDLARPAGSSSPWAAIADLPDLGAAQPKSPPKAAPRAPSSQPPGPPKATGAKPPSPPKASSTGPTSPPKALSAGPPSPPQTSGARPASPTGGPTPPSSKPVSPSKPPTPPPPQVAGSGHPDEDVLPRLGDEGSAFLLDADEDQSAFLLDADEEAPAPAAEDDADSAPDVPVSYQAKLGELDINLKPPGQFELPDDDGENLDTAVLAPEAEEVGYDPQEEDEEAAGFTLSRTASERVEELDLAAMVDVAFQMVLFFLVTSMTLVFKTLELPRTKPDTPPGAVGQGQQPKNLDDLVKNDYILVEINAKGEIRIDHELASPQNLIDRLRVARKDTGRKGMLLSADFATPHRNAVLAYDAANEIGLSIAIAKPGQAADAPLPPAGGGG